ncbi:unnamed protein product [Linum trigynum]|uniref:Uncharacterized protein n=1 Tax=Linum trigynum TaxID=586398 RepID=A0AAV2DSI2_9ROSI
MDSFGDDEFPELTYYVGTYCDSCRRMAKTEMKEEYDDDDYIYEDDDFGGDDTLKLRMIHYRRNLRVNGCFYADCPPQSTLYPGFDDTVQDCAEFAVETFNDELGAEMELREIENVSVGGFGYRQIYMILRCCNVGSSGDGGPDEKTYRVVVSCCWWRKANKKVLVFNDCYGNNLLKPNRSFDERTTPEQRSPHPIQHDA